jgi:hypothetical protein
MIKRHYKSDKESKREQGVGFGSSDPTRMSKKTLANIKKTCREL